MMSTDSPFLSARSLRPEAMDQPDLDAGMHRHALRGLARLNWWSGSSRPFRRPLGILARSNGGRPARVLDVASGGGEVPVALACWAGRRGLAIELTLCDINPRAVDIALRRAASKGVTATGLVRDVTAGPLPGGFDAVFSSLFLHHLPRASALRALGNMARAAGRLLVVCDVNRSLPGLALAAGASRLLTRSPVVHMDAPRSVRAAFTVDEVRGLADGAGLSGARIDRCWPQRWRLEWWKP